jgi:hypothetical protein
MSPRGYQPCGKPSCSQYIAELNACVKEWKLYASKLEHELQQHQPRPDPLSALLTTTDSVSPEPISSHSIPPQRVLREPLSSSSVSCSSTYTQPADSEPAPLQNAPLSPPASTLKVIEWTPQCSRSWGRADGPKQSCDTSNASQDKTQASTIQNFIGRIPNPYDDDQWQQKRAELGLNDAQGILRALDDVLSPQRHSDAKTRDTVQLPLNVLDHLAYRAIEAGEAGSDAQRAVALSIFSGLVFMGECCVALKIGVNIEYVDNSMRDFLSRLRSSSCQAGSKTLQMYRHVAVWITQQMYLLFEDFHHRAFELFLYGTLVICTAVCRCLSAP